VEVIHSIQSDQAGPEPADDPSLQPILALRSRYSTLMCVADLWSENAPNGGDPELAGRLQRLADKMADAEAMQYWHPSGVKVTLAPVTIADLVAASSLCHQEESLGWAWALEDMQAEAEQTGGSEVRNEPHTD
jgi:hypothetical protein